MSIDIKDNNTNTIICTYYGNRLRNSDFQNKDLENANFSDCNLRGADFKGANLKNANFTNSNLVGIDLSNSNLEKAVFKNANLTGANLTDANLTDTDFFNCLGNGKEVITFQTEYFTLNFRKSILTAGCLAYTYDEWANFSDEAINKLGNEDIVAFRNKYKPIILTLKALYGF